MPRAKADKRTATLGELAGWLALTDRRVRQLTEQGVIASPVRKRYDVAASVRAYIDYLRQSPDLTIGTLDFARRRKVEAEAALAEIELGLKRGEMMTVSDAVAQLSSRFERVRARMLNIPGKFAPQMLGIHTIAEAQLRLEAAVGEAMAELAATADEEDSGDASDMAGRVEDVVA